MVNLQHTATLIGLSNFSILQNQYATNHFKPYIILFSFNNHNMIEKYSLTKSLKHIFPPSTFIPTLISKIKHELFHVLLFDLVVSNREKGA